MDLEAQIRNINDQLEFVKICNAVFTAKYGHDFQIIDGSRPDGGNDGYIQSEKRLLAIYCPTKPENRTDKDFQDKINTDLEKAKNLRDSGKFAIEEWSFITPGKLSNAIIIKLREKAQEFGFNGNHLEATFLSNELHENQYLLEKFPRLYLLTLEPKIEEILRHVKPKQASKEETDILINKRYEKTTKDKESQDLKRVFEILEVEQSDKSKTELRTIFYKTTDKIAQVNAILGLLHWNDSLEDKDEDMVEWCNQGIRISVELGDKLLQAMFLLNKGFYLSRIWAKKDIETYYVIRKGNIIGIQAISEEELQIRIKELKLLEEAFLNAFKNAMDIGIELQNVTLLAQVYLKIGQAAEIRFIHLNKIGTQDRAIKEMVLAKSSLIHAKNLYTAIGYELGVGYALHNLANSLFTFGEKEEAKGLNKTVIEIAQKYNDNSLLQTAIWLKENLETGRIPDYVHGERRERKK